MTPPALLKRLERFSPEDGRLILAWLEENPVGANLGLKLLELLEDLAKKESRPISDFFGELPQGEQIQPKERGRLWRDRLARRLHPHLQAHEATFAEKLRQIGLSDAIEIEAPQGFEGPNFTLKVRFADKEELRRRLLEALESLEKQDWAGLWEF